MVPPCLHRIDDRANTRDFSQRVFAVVVNAVGAWTEETLPAIPNTAKHLADVLAGTDVRTNKCPFLVNRTTKVWVLRSGCPILQNRTVYGYGERSAHEEDHDDDHGEAGQVGEGERFAGPCHCGDGGHDRFAGAEHGARTAPTRITPAM